MSKKQFVLLVGVIISLVFFWYAFSVQVHDVSFKKEANGIILLEFKVSNSLSVGRQLTYEVIFQEPKSGQNVAKASGNFDISMFGQEQINSRPKNINPHINLDQIPLPFIHIYIKENGIIISSWEGSIMLQS